MNENSDEIKRPAICTDLDVETDEGNTRFSAVRISASVTLPRFGMEIDKVDIALIREAVRKAVEDAVTYKTEAKNEQT